MSVVEHLGTAIHTRHYKRAKFSNHEVVHLTHELKMSWTIPILWYLLNPQQRKGIDVWLFVDDYSGMHVVEYKILRL